MWARIISVAFHPLFIPTYFFFLLSWTVPALLEPISPPAQLKFLLFLFLVTCVVPLVNVGIFRTFGTVRSFAMRTRRERLLPFILICVIFIAVTYMFHQQAGMNMNDNFMKFMVVIDMLVIAATVATFFMKVSVHSVTIWGLIGILVPLNRITEVDSVFYLTVCVILLAGFIMAARLQTGAHSFREVTWGAILGLATAVGGMWIVF